jgi:hypothetical protein
VCSKGNHFWIIKTNPFDHKCVQEITHLDHKQLTVKMIAENIKRELAEDMTLTIKIIRALLRTKILGVDSFYFKI